LTVFLYMSFENSHKFCEATRDNGIAEQ
jgi:hypothetical protein